MLQLLTEFHSLFALKNPNQKLLNAGKNRKIFCKETERESSRDTCQERARPTRPDLQIPVVELSRLRHSPPLPPPPRWPWSFSHGKYEFPSPGGFCSVGAQGSMNPGLPPSLSFFRPLFLLRLSLSLTSLSFLFLFKNKLFKV